MPGYFMKFKSQPRLYRSAFLLILIVCFLLTALPVICMAEQVSFSVPLMKFFQNTSPTPPDPGSRQYATSFDRFKTRYIMAEFDVQRSVVGTAYDASYMITWYDSHGLRASQESGTLHWEPTQDTAKSINAYGSKYTGIFLPGTYKVELSIDDRIQASAKYEITQSFLSLNPEINSPRFFESKAPPVDVGSRKYATTFNTTATHFIWWELNTQYVVSDTRLSIPVHAQVYRGSSLVAKDDYMFIIDEGASRSLFVGGIGANTAGTIPAGLYKVLLSVDGTELAAGAFTVIKPMSKTVIKKLPPVKKPPPKKAIKKKMTTKK